MYSGRSINIPWIRCGTTHRIRHLQALRQHLQAIGMQRVVLVQPSVYGFDNQCLLDALTELGDSARGVAVAPRDVSEAQLKVWHAAGVRAIRVNLQSSGNEDVASACNELLLE